MKSILRQVEDHGVHYQALAFCCPGCAEMHSNMGLHIIPVNTTEKKPSWDWDGNLEAPTLSPSIRTQSGGVSGPTVCHSFLRAGVFEFLGDCTHSMANQQVPMPDIPEDIFR